MAYCTYLTIYSGDKLPPFYIGSTSIEKYEAGYCGSVASKKYKQIFKDEIKNNPHLFDVLIISEHETRQEALDAEFELHIRKNVVQDSNFMNMAFCIPNGFFGRSVVGDSNPNYGKTASAETRAKIGAKKNHKGENNPHYGKEVSAETRAKISAANLGRSVSEACKHQRSVAYSGKGNPNYGKKHTPEALAKMSAASTGRAIGKPLIVNGILYKNKADAITQLNMCVITFNKYLKAINPRVSYTVTRGKTT